MRTLPVGREEVRIIDFALVAAPLDAFVKDPRGYPLVIPELFEPLLVELRAERQVWLDSEAYRQQVMLRAQLGLRPIYPPEPRLPRNAYRWTCSHCQSGFFSTFTKRGRQYCSDRCLSAAAKAVQARHIAERAERRRAARAGLACAHCGAELAARRASRRYCSGRCRVAALRQRCRNRQR
jgi:hypothetical protein